MRPLGGDVTQVNVEVMESRQIKGKLVVICNTDGILEIIAKLNLLLARHKVKIAVNGTGSKKYLTKSN